MCEMLILYSLWQKIAMCCECEEAQTGCYEMEKYQSELLREEERLMKCALN